MSVGMEGGMAPEETEQKRQTGGMSSSGKEPDSALPVKARKSSLALSEMTISNEPTDRKALHTSPSRLPSPRRPQQKRITKAN